MHTATLTVVICVVLRVSGFGLGILGNSKDADQKAEGSVGSAQRPDDLLRRSKFYNDILHLDEENPEQDGGGGGGGSLVRNRKHDKERRGPKIWDQWGKWSACTVTCGVGKIIRWRHCVSGGCASGEKEAQIKTCTLPAC